jgi:hypothetical protein
LTIWDAAALGSCRVPASGSRGDTRRRSDDHQVHPSASEATLTAWGAQTQPCTESGEFAGKIE